MNNVSKIMKRSPRLLGLVMVLLAGYVSAADGNRIISTDAGMTDIIIKLGKGSELVAVDITSHTPDDIKVQKVGYHRNLSAEGLLSLKPTVVFGNEHIGPKETVDLLKKSNTHLELLPTAFNTQQLLDNVEVVAKALAVPAEPLVNQIKLANRQLTNTASERAGHSAVFLLYLEGRGLKQAGSVTAGSAILDVLGFNNQADYSGYRTISPENLLAQQPDVILVGGQDETVVETLIEQYPTLKYTNAYTSKKFLFIDASTLISGVSLQALNEAVRLSESL